MSIVLACDLGGTHFRAALVDADGAMIAEHRAACPVSQGLNGFSEIDPQDWWNCLTDAAEALYQTDSGLYRQVDGIAICGVTRTQVLMGQDGTVLRPAITWKDTRAEEEIVRLKALMPANHPETADVNVFHPLARLYWLKRHEPALFEQLPVLLDPKDYLNFCLTGRRASDPVSMARLAAAAKPDQAGQGLLTAAGVPETLLPALLEPSAKMGVVQAHLEGALGQLAGCPVFCCANDTWTAVVGLGAMQAGMAYNISGTTEVFGVISSQPALAEGLLSVNWCGLHQLGGPGQNGADTASWLATVLGKSGDSVSVNAMLTELLEKPRDPQPLLFLPYLQGERTPYWDPRLRGGFIGLNRDHAATDLAWAVLEGVAFLNKAVLEKAENALKIQVSEVRFGGGASGSAVWRQLKADICERPVLAGAASEPGILGAAAVAFTGLGVYPDLVSAQRKLVRISHHHRPNARRAGVYRQLFDLFKQCSATLAPTSRALADMSGEWQRVTR